MCPFYGWGKKPQKRTLLRITAGKPKSRPTQSPSSSFPPRSRLAPGVGSYFCWETFLYDWFTNQLGLGFIKGSAGNTESVLLSCFHPAQRKRMQKAKICNWTLELISAGVLVTKKFFIFCRNAFLFLLNWWKRRKDTSRWPNLRIKVSGSKW